MEHAIAALDAKGLTPGILAPLGNTVYFGKTLLGWAALRNDLEACKLCLDSGCSPNSINGSLPPLMVALTVPASAELCYLLAAAGATMTCRDEEMADEWVRLLFASRDKRLIRNLVTMCGLPRPRDRNGIMFGHLVNTVNSHRYLLDPMAHALNRVRNDIKPGSRAWWRNIHRGQRQRVVAFLTCVTRLLPPEIIRHVFSFLGCTTRG